MSDTSDFKKLDLDDPTPEDEGSFATWLPPLLSTNPSPAAPAVTLTGLGPPSGPRASSSAEVPAANDLAPASRRTVAPFFDAPAEDPLAVLSNESFQKDVVDAFSEDPPAPPLTPAPLLRDSSEPRPAGDSLLRSPDESLLRASDEALLRDADDDDDAPTQVISQLFPNLTPRLRSRLGGGPEIGTLLMTPSQAEAARVNLPRVEAPTEHTGSVAGAPANVLDGEMPAVTQDGDDPWMERTLPLENRGAAPAIAANTTAADSIVAEAHDSRTASARAPTPETDLLATVADSASKRRPTPPVRYSKAPMVRVSDGTSPGTPSRPSSNAMVELLEIASASLSPPEVPTSAHPESAHRPPLPVYPPTIEVAQQVERELPTAPSSRRPTPPRVEAILGEPRLTPVRSEPPWAATVGPKASSPRMALRYALLAFAASALVTVFVLRSLIPGKGSVMITAVGVAGMPVENAQVLVDGAVACAPVPCRVSKLREGRHLLTVKAPGYQPTEPKPINIESGNDSLVSLALTPESNAGLHVRVSTRGLRVFLDGEDRGEAPLTIGGLTPTEHTIRVAGSPLYAPFEQKIALKPNSTLTFAPELLALQAFITITAGAGAESASVEVIGGPQRKAVVELPARIEVPPLGSYRVRAKRRGYQDYETEVRFAEGEAEKQVRIELAPIGAPAPAAPGSAVAKPVSNALPVVLEETPAKPAAPAAVSNGTLSLSSVPASNVIVNGRPIGPTPQKLTLAAGSHSVVFVHPVRGRKTLSVKVEPGKNAVASTKF